MQLINVEKIRKKVAGYQRSYQKNILRKEYEKYREKLEGYYRSSRFKKGVLQYMHEIYYPYIKKQEVVSRIDTSKIEFGTSMNTFDNFLGTIIGIEKKEVDRIIYRLVKPKLNVRDLFFKNLDELYEYCIKELPPSIFAGAVWEENKIKYRHIVFDFDYRDHWKDALMTGLYTMYFAAFIFGIKRFYMYRSGWNGVHLYPATLTSLIYNAQRHQASRGYLADLLVNAYAYAEILVEPFVISKQIYNRREQIKQNIKILDDRIEVSFGDVNGSIMLDLEDYEEYQIFQKKLGLINRTARIREMKKIRQYTPSAYYIEKVKGIEEGGPQIIEQEKLILDTAVTKDIRRMIRLPASIHPITYVTVDPIYFNNKRTIEIYTGPKILRIIN